MELMMQLRGVEVVDTFAEAFSMSGDAAGRDCRQRALGNRGRQ